MLSCLHYCSGKQWMPVLLVSFTFQTYFSHLVFIGRDTCSYLWSVLITVVKTAPIHKEVSLYRLHIINLYAHIQYRGIAKLYYLKLLVICIWNFHTHASIGHTNMLLGHYDPKSSITLYCSIAFVYIKPIQYRYTM